MIQIAKKEVRVPSFIANIILYKRDLQNSPQKLQHLKNLFKKEVAYEINTKKAAVFI